ncbi:MAG: hypothetical protein PVH61_35240 [Candidatus Aminicenantes bacterium]|jgi:hypothetical protein
MTKHTKTFGLLIFWILLLFNFTACQEVPKEKPVIEIDVKFPGTAESPEMSGMAWYKDYLIILPQYPHLFKSDYQGKLFAVPKAQILSYLDEKMNKKTNPPAIEPQAIEFIFDKKLFNQIEDFEGFEAIGFWDDRVFITIEASPPRQMMGYLTSGQITTGANNQMTIAIKGKIIKIQPQACISNAAYESLVVTKETVMVFFEGNGVNVNASPLAHVYNHDLEFVHAIAFPPIEYRITDATGLDTNNRFWCINYFWPDAKDKNSYLPAEDPIAKTYGEGKTHKKAEIVERLVEFEYIEPNNNKYAKIVLVDSPPIQMELLGSAQNDARNWEGLVRLDNRGFLLITDEHPKTMLGFIASGGQGDSFRENRPPGPPAKAFN